MDRGFTCKVCGGHTLTLSDKFGLCCTSCGVNPFRLNNDLDKHKKTKTEKNVNKKIVKKDVVVKKSLSIGDVKSLFRGFECFVDSVLKFFEAVYRIFGYLIFITVDGLKFLSKKVNDKKKGVGKK